MNIDAMIQEGDEINARADHLMKALKKLPKPTTINEALRRGTLIEACKAQLNRWETQKNAITDNDSKP